MGGAPFCSLSVRLLGGWQRDFDKVAVTERSALKAPVAHPLFINRTRSMFLLAVPNASFSEAPAVALRNAVPERADISVFCTRRNSCNCTRTVPPASCPRVPLLLSWAVNLAPQLHRTSRAAASFPLSTLPAQPQHRVLLSHFRMNTCKSVSKQTTLSTCRMNTYAKPGGRGPRRSLTNVQPQVSEFVVHSAARDD